MRKLECNVGVTNKGLRGKSGGKKVKVVDENVCIDNVRLISRLR